MISKVFHNRRVCFPSARGFHVFTSKVEPCHRDELWHWEREKVPSLLRRHSEGSGGGWWPQRPPGWTQYRGRVTTLQSGVAHTYWFGSWRRRASGPERSMSLDGKMKWSSVSIFFFWNQHFSLFTWSKWRLLVRRRRSVFAKSPNEGKFWPSALFPGGDVL